MNQSMKKKHNKISLLNRLAEARSSLVIAACDMDIVYGEGKNPHAAEMIGAAEMIHDWIINIRAEV
jgi:hypothetical protein